MPYLNVDDGMDEHPKVESLTDAAFRMHMSGMLYCARRGTDGAIPRAKARRLSDSATDGVAAELIRAGVWHDLGEGCTDSRTCLPGLAAHYIVHDFLQWNHSTDWWTNRSEDQAAKGSKSMHRRWHVRRGVFREDCKHCQSDAVADNKCYSNGYSNSHNTSNNKSITEPEPEPEPEPIPVSTGPALENSSPASTTDRTRGRSFKASNQHEETA